MSRPYSSILRVVALTGADGLVINTAGERPDAAIYRVLAEADAAVETGLLRKQWDGTYHLTVAGQKEIES